MHSDISGSNLGMNKTFYLMYYSKYTAKLS